MRDKFFDYFSNEKLYIFSHYSLIKDSPVQLFHKIIDEGKVENVDFYKEIDNFKKRTNKQ